MQGLKPPARVGGEAPVALRSYFPRATDASPLIATAQRGELPSSDKLSGSPAGGIYMGKGTHCHEDIVPFPQIAASQFPPLHSANKNLLLFENGGCYKGKYNKK